MYSLQLSPCMKLLFVEARLLAAPFFSFSYLWLCSTSWSLCRSYWGFSRICGLLIVLWMLIWLVLVTSHINTHSTIIFYALWDLGHIMCIYTTIHVHVHSYHLFRSQTHRHSGNMLPCSSKSNGTSQIVLVQWMGNMLWYDHPPTVDHITSITSTASALYYWL